MKFPDVLYDSELPDYKVSKQTHSMKESKKQKGIFFNLMKK